MNPSDKGSGAATGGFEQGLGFYRLRQVLELYPVSAATWWRGVRSGKYPKAYKLGANTTGWLKTDIHDLLERTKEQAAA